MEEVMTLEEQIYWKHFNAMHFYQVLPHDFLEHLVLPSKFAENMSCKIPKKLSLIGPGGTSWEVEVSTVGDLALVGEGWKNFAETYNLEENLLLMFKYTQELSFEVLIFDQQTFCEKECSYFVKKYLSNPNNTNDSKRSADEMTSTYVMEDIDDSASSDCAMSKKLKKCYADHGKKDVFEAPRATPSNTSSNDFSNDNDDDSVEVVSSGVRPIHKVSVSVLNEADVPEGIPTAGLVSTNSTVQSDTQRLSMEYMSHRRAVTDEEKAATLKQATEALTEDSFIVVMRPGTVYKRFYLTIPADWVNKNLSCQHQKVILRVGEKTWVAMFHNYGPGRNSGALTTGWKNFAIENNLEDADVCVFKRAGQEGDFTLVFDVKIFRVVPEITPLTPLLCSIV